jgi:hypothetical protein
MHSWRRTPDFVGDRPRGVSSVETLSPFEASDPPGRYFSVGGELRPTGRGIGSCYLELPAFADPFNDVEFEFYQYQGKLGLSPGPHIVQGESDLSLRGATATTDSGTGPTTLGDPTQWTCRPTRDSLLSACGVTLTMTEPWFQTFQNLMLLVIGALTAAVVTLVIRAADAWHPVEGSPIWSGGRAP